jgi:hypothetical protein
MLLNAIRAALRSGGEHIVPPAEQPLRAAANDGDRLFAVETHPSPGGPVLKALRELREYAATEADNRNLSQLVIEITARLDILEKRGLPNSKLPANRTRTEAGGTLKPAMPILGSAT